MEAPRSKSTRETELRRGQGSAEQWIERRQIGLGIIRVQARRLARFSLFPATIKDRWRYSRQQLVSWRAAKRPPGVDSMANGGPPPGAGLSFVSGREGADASPYGADTGREAAGSFWLNVVPLLLVGTRLSIARPTRREDAGIDGERMGTREREGDLILWMIVNGDERGWMREDFWEELFLGWRERKRGRFFLCSGFLVLWIKMRIYI